MVYDLYIAPSKNGHFLNYYETLTAGSAAQSSVFCVAGGTFDILRAVLRQIRIQKSRPDRVHLLFGENAIIASLFLRCFLLPVTAIFYYVQHRPYRALRRYVSGSLLWLGRLLGVRQLSLEAPTSLSSGFFEGVLLDYIVGPPVALPAVRKDKTDNVSCLIAGYITPRKMVVEIITALAQVQRQTDTQIELHILGEVEGDYRSIVEAAIAKGQSEQFKIFQNAKRISDSELQDAILGADIVLALYRNHFGSSGMILNAMAANRPVLFIARGALKLLARKLPDAHLPTSEQQIEIALAAIIHAPTDFLMQKSSHSEFLKERSKSAYFSTYHTQNK